MSRACEVPLIVRNPYTAKRGVRNAALVSHVDLTPTMLDFAGGLDKAKNAPIKPVDADAFWKEHNLAEGENRGKKYPRLPWPFLARTSWTKRMIPRAIVIFASHTFHEVQMYYPMRVIRDRILQADLEHRQPPALPVCLGPVGRFHLAGSAQEGEGRALRSQDRGPIHSPSRFRTVRHANTTRMSPRIWLSIPDLPKSSSNTKPSSVNFRSKAAIPGNKNGITSDRFGASQQASSVPSRMTSSSSGSV